MFLTSIAQASIGPPELIIEEKPDYVHIGYTQRGILAINGLIGHNVQLVKSPLQEGSEIKTELEEGLRSNHSTIILVDESNYGDYEMLVDGTQPIKFSIGKKIIEGNIRYENMQNTLFYSGITTAILGALLLLTTILLRTKKTKKTTRRIRIIGILLIVIGTCLLGIYLIPAAE